MKIAIALAMVIGCPSVAAAQYLFQLRPSPYRILSGWQQSANTYRTQSVDAVVHTTTAVSARQRSGVSDDSGHAHGDAVNGNADHGPAAHD